MFRVKHYLFVTIKLSEHFESSLIISYRQKRHNELCYDIKLQNIQTVFIEKTVLVGNIPEL